MSSAENTVDRDQPPVLDDGVLRAINEASHTEGMSSFDNSQGSRLSTSMGKESYITEASPEPEPVAVRMTASASNDDEEEEYFTAKYRKAKRFQIWLISLSAALGVALLGTLIGLIIVSTQSAANQSNLPASFTGVPASQSNSSLATNHLYNPRTLRAEYKPLSFPRVEASSPLVANAIADHSLYQTFYGITYDKYVSGDTDMEIQQNIAQDLALLSRVTTRVRLTLNQHHLVDRALQVLRDINFQLHITLSIDTDYWNTHKAEFLRLLCSYPDSHIDTIELQWGGLTSFDEFSLIRADILQFLAASDLTKLRMLNSFSQHDQANPLELTKVPELAIGWINADLTTNVYTNLEPPSETSERARFTHSWCCDVVPHLREGIEWYWSNTFDSSAKGITNGIFTESRELKPAGLPRCNAG